MPHNHHSLLFALMFLLFFPFLGFIRICSLVCSWIFQNVRQDFQTFLLDAKINSVKKKNFPQAALTTLSSPNVNFVVGVSFYHVFPIWTKLIVLHFVIFSMKSNVIAMFCKQQWFNFLTIVALKHYNKQ